MDGMNITPTTERASIMRRVEMIFSTWAHQMAPEVDWRVALQKDYWSNVASKLQPGDKIECHSHDHSVAFIIYIVDINVSASPSWWDVAYLPLHPRDLDLPQPELAPPPRYVVRPSLGAGGSYRVLDQETGQAVHPNDKPLHAARELAAEMNAALAHTVSQVRAALHRAQEATDDPAAMTRAERNRERSRLWREKDRAAKAAAAEAAAAQGGEAP
jgi:hypothetical protein